MQHVGTNLAADWPPKKTAPKDRGTGFRLVDGVLELSPALDP